MYMLRNLLILCATIGIVEHPRIHHTNQGDTNQGDRFLIEFSKFTIKNLSP